MFTTKLLPFFYYKVDKRRELRKKVGFIESLSYHRRFQSNKKVWIGLTYWCCMVQIRQISFFCSKEKKTFVYVEKEENNKTETDTRLKFLFDLNDSHCIQHLSLVKPSMFTFGAVQILSDTFLAIFGPPPPPCDIRDPTKE